MSERCPASFRVAVMHPISLAVKPDELVMPDIREVRCIKSIGHKGQHEAAGAPERSRYTDHWTGEWDIPTDYRRIFDDWREREPSA